MPTTMTFAKVQSYLDAIAQNANGDVSNSPHNTFWKVSYAAFTTGNVPNVIDPTSGAPVPIIDPGDPAKSPFYQVLLGSWHTFNQMPDGGPFITDPGFALMIAGGVVTGIKIQADLLEWLQNGFPQ